MVVDGDADGGLDRGKRGAAPRKTKARLPMSRKKRENPVRGAPIACAVRTIKHFGVGNPKRIKSGRGVAANRPFGCNGISQGGAGTEIAALLDRPL